MAGDWIKMRGNLWDDPRVSKLCDLCDCGEAQVIGALYWLWAAADQHTEDGCMPGLTLRQIDRKTGVPGFGAAMCEVGWLRDDPQGVVIVKFEEHNGTSAKRRCTDAQRKANGRSMSASDADKLRTEGGCEADEMRRFAELEKEKEKELSEEANASSSSLAEPPTAKRGEVPCPYAEIIAVYHELLPMLPAVRIVTEKRKREMRKRWAWVLSSRKPNGERRATSADQAISWFRDYFGRCADDAFITGQTPRGRGHEGWEADLSYVLRDDCLVRIAEKTGRAAA